jgi:hypothetical protein
MGGSTPVSFWRSEEELEVVTRNPLNGVER